MLRMLPLKLTLCVSSLGRVIDSLLVGSQSLMTVKFTSLFNCFQNNRGKGRLNYLLQQTELFAHFSKGDQSSSQKKTKGRYALGYYLLCIVLLVSFWSDLWIFYPNMYVLACCKLYICCC